MKIIRIFFYIFIFNSIITPVYAGIALNLRCEIIFSLKPSDNPEYWNLQYLKEYLFQNVSYFYVKNYVPQSQFSIMGSAESAQLYTSNDGHRKINSSIWKFDPFSEANSDIIPLYYFLLNDNSTLTESYAGATIPKHILEKLMKEKTFQPGYFFSSSKQADVAENFMYDSGNHHSSESNVKVMYHINGYSGKDLSAISYYNESEFLYVPDTQFEISQITKRQSLHRLGFEIYDVYLNEKEVLPVKNKQLLQFHPSRDLIKLQSLETYHKLKNSGVQNTLDKYSDNTKIDFQNAIEFIYKNFKTLEPNINTLQKIHQIATQNMNFEGIYRQIIRDDFLSGKLTENQAIEELYNIQNSRMKTDFPTSRFRQKWIESFIMNGLHFNTAKNRWYFTNEELYYISVNPYYQLKKQSLKQINDNQWTADVVITPGPFVETLVKEAFTNAIPAIRNAKSDKEYVLQVLKLQQALISIHPFHDGNGRTIKLFSDLLFLKRGISPILHPINDDYSLTLNKLYQRTVQSMTMFQNYTIDTNQ